MPSSIVSVAKCCATSKKRSMNALTSPNCTVYQEALSCVRSRYSKYGSRSWRISAVGMGLADVKRRESWLSLTVLMVVVSDTET